MNKIDRLRKGKGLSYRAIAEKAGVTTPYIQMLAKHKRNNPSFEVMRRIAIALDEKVERVFSINKPKEGDPCRKKQP